ncbi:cytochrome c3 family protein [Planctomycetota bacterium]
MNKRLIVKTILWFFMAFGITVGAIRMKSGLGATTNLSDFTPWGLWVGFDVMAGVALAAGGFVLAATVYVFGLERFRPLLRATILTAFLGYIIVAVGLIFDLGIPWHIWHPMIMWQHHSVLFEVAMCVMIYSTVLALEVAPVVLEHPLLDYPVFKTVYKLLKLFTIPLVILGIMLSTLHQSSLGALFLLMPTKTHPLWYSHIIYVLYFISAVALGFGMVIFEASITAWLYDHKPGTDLLKTLGRACSVILGIYFITRIVDLMAHGKIALIFDGSWQANLFVLEMLIATILPIILFNIKKIFSSPIGLFLTASLVVLGFIMNRLDTSIVTFARPEGSGYFPSVTELGLTLGLISFASLVFIFFVENLNLFGEMPKARGKYTKPEFDKTFIYVTDSRRKTFSAASMGVVLAVGFALALIPSSAMHGYDYPDTPVQDSVGWDILKIDGNRAKEFVMFPHKDHIQRMVKNIGDERKACIKCHHMSKPGDGPTGCFECHRDMYLSKSIFDHDYHQSVVEGGGNKSCIHCHTKSKAREQVKSCNACHENMLDPDEENKYIAPSYMDAMHESCIKCHEQAAKAHNKPGLNRCNTCHQGMPDTYKK